MTGIVVNNFDVTLIIHQIFSLICDWSKCHMTECLGNIPQSKKNSACCEKKNKTKQKLSMIYEGTQKPPFYSKNIPGYFVLGHYLFLKAHSFPLPSDSCLAIFRKCPENVRKHLSGLRNNFGKSSEIFGKWSEIFRKSSSLVCLYNKQNITCPCVDMNFIFSCSTRYRVEHSKIKFISTHGHVISPMYSGHETPKQNKSSLNRLHKQYFKLFHNNNIEFYSLECLFKLLLVVIIGSFSIILT